MYAGNHENLHKPFFLDGTELESKYKYLGFFFNEHMNMREIIRPNVLSKVAGWSLSGIVAKFASFRDAGFQTYRQLYESCAVPIFQVYGAF